jgi:hypothetical protein
MLDKYSVKYRTSWHLRRLQYEKSWDSLINDDMGSRILFAF